MATADRPDDLLHYRIQRAEREIAKKADQSDLDLIRADIRDMKDGIRNWSIAMFGSSCVIVAGIFAVVHPHIN